ncbi:MAG: phosphopantetheine-binding protein [Spirochaetes bacterium]|nr:phosphopantetheine-binding protein [Spirochaetota bacterium]
MSATVEKIVKVLVEYRDFDAATVTRDTTFGDLGLDSLDTVDLVMKLEEEFGMEIPMTTDIKTIGNLADFIDGAK